MHKGYLAAATCLAVMAFGAASAAADIQVVEDKGFEHTQCAGADCTNSDWVAEDQSLFCLKSACDGKPAKGKGWGLLGGGSVEPMGTQFGHFEQELPDYPGYGATFSFDLKRGVAPAGNIDARFAVNFTGGSGGQCCFYDTEPAPSHEGWKHISFPVDPDIQRIMSLSTFCENNGVAPATCPTFEVDNAKFVYDTPEITLTKKPKSKTTSHQAKFSFTTDAEPVPDFECSLDGGAYETCLSPRIYSVGKGQHIFRIRAQGEDFPPEVSYHWKVVNG